MGMEKEERIKKVQLEIQSNKTNEAKKDKKHETERETGVRPVLLLQISPRRIKCDEP